MYSQEELNISNKSYINKDFPTLYNELLDIAQKISYKFDPTTSNESDPMIVLCKLIALSGDKLNYNVDKNILERFLTSITQWNSMQERTSSLGYNMHYYNSSIGYINIKYNKNINSDDVSLMTGDDTTIKFPAFTTKFSNSSNNVNYILTKDVEFTKDELLKHTAKEGTIIQGDIKLFTTLNGDESTVSLNDLDSLNRLYFPEAMVAQNGIFIEQDNILDEDKWHLVDNLNAQLPLTRCYVFRYDSSRKLPYIQFPDDISSLINEGLTIRYIVTNGEDGNVSANNIDTLLVNGIANGFEPEEDTLTNLENYIITNPSALTNGQDIEGIDEAYNNFYKTVGTFDTLVACRDYANYIYNLTDEDFNYLVSNCQVCDRRDDYNYSTKVVTYNDFGQTEIIPVNDNVTAFDLMLYPLQPLLANDVTAYKSSFKVLDNTNRIVNNLEATKCLSHNYKKLDNDDVYAIKNYYQLKAKITTTYKVNSLEQLAIKNNIVQALIKNFNPRKVDYGQEIPYDTILKVIENADSRIKFVSLDEPYLNTKIMLKSNAEKDWANTTGDGSTYKLKYIAKNVLAGKTSLYKYDEKFSYTYEQTDTQEYNEVSTVTTCTDIIPTEVSGLYNYTLRQNEVIQLFTPSFINGREWSYGWFYSLEGDGWNSYSGEETVTELNSNKKINIYDSKDAVSPSVTLSSNYVKLKGINNTSTIKQINSGATITEQSINEVTLNDTCNLYWITNNIEIDDTTNVKKSKLNWDTNNNYVLLDNEYLYMTDTRFSFLTTFGPGTKIHKTSSISGMDAYLEVVDLEELETQGLIYLKDKFVEIELNNNDDGKQLILTEQQILTLTEGDSYNVNKVITYTETDASSIKHNILSPLENDTEFSYTLTDGSTGTIVTENGGYIRARLDISSSPVKSQRLLSNQYLAFTYDNEGSEATANLTNITIQFGYETDIIGGTDRVVEIYNFTEKTYINNTVYKYNLVTDQDNALTKISDKFGNYYKVLVISGICRTQSSVKLYTPCKTSQDTLIMIYVSPSDVEQIEDGVVTTLSITNGGYNLTTASATGYQLRAGINVLKLTTSDTSPITITFNKYDDSSVKFTGNIVISTPRILVSTYDSYASINNLLGIENATETSNLLTEINNYKETFYYNLFVDNANYIDESLMDAYTLFNSNNVANKITIAEIDMDYAISNIDVAKSSQL